MAQRFPSVALIGATGNLGKYILKALQQAQPAFQSIRVLTRSAASASTAVQGPGIEIREVDYSSHESLVAALQGMDAVVSAIGTESVAGQEAIVDAAAEAGVRFFVPSQFGLADTHPLLQRDFPIFADKNRVQERLERYRAEGRLEYALVFVGLWLDWGLRSGFLLDLARRRVALWDGGERPISFTTLESISQAVVAVLSGHAGEEGRGDRVGPDGWEVKTLDTAKAKEVASEKLARGTATLDDIYAFVYRAATAEEYGQPWKPEEDDSERMGLQPWTEEDVKDLIRRIIDEKQ
ncbi:hypothetical protein VTH82DRAFT_6089 [Thermothelomyces myriococcoides]